MGRKFDIDYLKILSKEIQAVPAWKELAESCRIILGKEIDDRRRKLEKMKDSVKHRKGDILVNVEYYPQVEKRAYYEASGDIISLTPGSIIRTAEVVQVHRNISYKDHPRTLDYIELSFVHKSMEARWFMPMQEPQEREILLKNAYTSGFEFFASRMRDEDLQRVYEHIGIYWEEAGANTSFIDFIGFVKNAQLELIPLWSYDDGSNNFPVLEPKSSDNIPAYEGGKWYLTSHVEITYDLTQFNETYNIDLNDLEDLFYFFAPIVLVLERITATIDFETPIKVGSVGQTTVIGFNSQRMDTDSDLDIRVASVAQTQVIGFSVYRFTE